MLLVLVLAGISTMLIYVIVLIALKEKFFNPRREYIERWMDPNQSKFSESGGSGGVEKCDLDDEIKMLKSIFGKTPELRNFYQALRQINPKLTINVFLVAVLLFSILVTLFFYYITRIPFYPALVMGFFVGFALPFMYVMFNLKRRLAKFSEHLPDALRIMVGGLKAGYGISGGFEMVSQDGPPPLNEEFRIVLAEMELGLSIEQALQNLVERVKTRDTEFFAMAISLQKETGGNLAELMETLEKTIRERQRIVREARALLAQSKMSALFLVLIPICLAFIVFHFNTQFAEVMFKNPTGVIMLIAAGGLQILGILLIRRLLNIPLY
jgi:tight adherence protein B